MSLDLDNLYSKRVKFRAWDKELKCMYDWYTYYDIIREAIPIDCGDEWTERCVVMQHINRLDCKGQEIYEFDIINKCYVVVFDPTKSSYCLVDENSTYNFEDFETLNVTGHIFKDKLETRNEINILSTEKNGYERLSNLLNGPLTVSMQGKVVTFKTVEHYYQIQKALFANNREIANKIWQAETGFEAKQLSKSIEDLNHFEWNKRSKEILATGMRISFKQNAELAKLLLSTGDSILTHKSEIYHLGRWETDFPEILMSLRAELKNN